VIIQNPLPIVPQDAIVLSEKLTLIADQEWVVFYHSAEPIFSYRVGDKVGMRTAQGMLTDLGLVRPKALAEAMGVNPSTIHRNREKYRVGGIEALNDPERVRSPYKLTPELQARGQNLLDEGKPHRAVARTLGVSPGTIDNAVKKGLLKEREERGSRRSKKELVGPQKRSDEAAASSAGIAVARSEERAMASVGELDEAKPVFEPAEAVQNAGVLLCLPALLEQGLIDVSKDVYGKLRKGFFGLQSVFLVLVFCALLRIKTVEQLSKHAPGELGRLLGLDRAPEVKTLRRKLCELGLLRRARDFAEILAKRWAKGKPESLGFLYVDGHVRAYNGRKHSLPKTFVPRRRLCMPATTDTWVNDADAQPLFFVTAAANESLLTIMGGEVLPEVRRLVGEGRRVTFIFDREGWSPATFKRWEEADFDVLTYRKGAYEAWPEECFLEVEVEVGGKKMKYRLGQRSIMLIKEKRNRKGEIKREAFWMREIRRLCESGHQTSVVTTRQDLGVIELSLRMFSRWSQENFFLYMRREYDLDHNPTYSVEPADPDRPVPNPVIKQKKTALTKLRKDLANAEKEYAEEAIANPEKYRPAMRRAAKSKGKLESRIRSLKERCEALKAEINALPKKVPLRQIKDEKLIVKLEEERKVLTDCIKMIAYRAETSLFNLLGQFYERHDDEGRSFLKSVFRSPADLIPNKDAGILTVRFHSMATPRANLALRVLCDVCTEKNILYPGTRLRLVYEGPKVASSIVRGQEA